LGFSLSKAYGIKKAPYPPQGSFPSVYVDNNGRTMLSSKRNILHVWKMDGTFEIDGSIKRNKAIEKLIQK